MIDLQTYWSAKWGIELRYPFLDVRLARFVLSVPYEIRLPDGGLKSLLRHAMADLLPRKLVDTPSKPPFDATFRLHIAPHLSEYAPLLSEGAWQSAPYVERQAARRLVERVAADSTDGIGWMEWQTAWDILMLERWMRALLGSPTLAPPLRTGGSAESVARRVSP
jgi:hypothetical protein